MLIFIETFPTIISLPYAPLMEIVTTLEHVYRLAIPFTDEFHITLVTFETLGDNALNLFVKRVRIKMKLDTYAICIELHDISHDVFFDNVNCII